MGQAWSRAIAGEDNIWEITVKFVIIFVARWEGRNFLSKIKKIAVIPCATQEGHCSTRFYCHCLAELKYRSRGGATMSCGARFLALFWRGFTVFDKIGTVLQFL